MKLTELFAGAEIEIPPNARTAVHATGLASDSRKVSEGDVFVAIPGNAIDGVQFVGEAITRGACAIVATRDLPGCAVPVLVAQDVRKALGQAACNFFGNPSSELVLLGVTGTNGKTTTAYLVESICAANGASVGLFSTVGIRFAGIERETKCTTPDALTLQKTLREMVDAGVDTVVMEISSHALAQSRITGLTFRAVAFTNLSREHLDYHKDMEDYFQAKRTLFTSHLSPGGLAVVNGDDTYTNRVYNEVRQLKRQAWKFSRQGNGEISAADVIHSAHGMKGTLKTPAGDIALNSSLIGLHNLDNILCATGLALAAGASRKNVQEGIQRVTKVPGRMERIEGKEITAFVDYAHSSDALAKAIEAARAITKGRLLVVFGCGGERDVGKRPLMGTAAAEADIPIVTSDNARGEDPLEIIAAITAGLESAGLRRMSAPKARSGERGYLVEADRAAAIALAVSLAKPTDTVLIAGKGHERFQEEGGVRRPFDDVEVVRKALE